MKLLSNSGTDRVIDVLREVMKGRASLDVTSPLVSLFAYGELREILWDTDWTRMIIPEKFEELGLFGSSSEKIAEENPLYKVDLGFRVFKLDSSNILA